MTTINTWLKYNKYYAILIHNTPIMVFLLMLFSSIQSNHTGLNINYLSIPMVVNLFFCLKNRKKLAIALTITVLVIILFFNKYNILVNYETWLNRGMPAAFEL